MIPLGASSGSNCNWGARFALDTRNATTGALMIPSPYTLVRVTAQWDVIPAVQLFARAENVLNRVYEEPEGFQAPYFQAFFGVKAKF